MKCYNACIMLQNISIFIFIKLFIHYRILKKMYHGLYKNMNVFNPDHIKISAVKRLITSKIQVFVYIYYVYMYLRKLCYICILNMFI